MFEDSLLSPLHVAFVATTLAVAWLLWARAKSSLAPPKLPLARSGTTVLRAGDCALTPAQRPDAIRDFARSFTSGGCMVMGMGQQKAEPLGSLASIGSTNATDVEAVMKEFAAAIEPRLDRGVRGATTLSATEICHRMAGYLAVTPGLQFSLHHKLPMALHQPRYVILLGQHQVRVATYAFVGGPVRGDRPDRKHTPFILKMLTENILDEGQAAPKEDDTVSIAYTCRAIQHDSTAEIVADDSDLMQAALSKDEWNEYATNA